MLSFGFLVFFVFGAVSGSQSPDAEEREQLYSSGRLESFPRHQDYKLSRQETLIRQLQETSAHQSNLIRQLIDKLSHQENLLRQQEDNQKNLMSEVRKLHLQLKGEERDSHYKSNHADEPRKLGAQQQQRQEGTSTIRDVSTRSDDFGQMEAVVSQLSQRVTEIKADVDAYKAQIGGDLQALRTQTSADIQTLKVSDSQQNMDIQDARSSDFVQWGSSTCGSNSTLVYSGIVGGSSWDHSGAAANYLCLTLSPVPSDVATGGASVLYGAEYETHDSHHNKDPVCAVCRSAFATTVMIPGTNVCTSGWHMQYSGYLMAGDYTDAAATEYICVDSKLGSFVGSDASTDGKLMYYVRAHCGGLPCSPYAENKVVTCAVCSK